MTIELPSVAGRMEMTHDAFQHACSVALRDLQENPNCDTHLVALLCEAVRCSRECCAFAVLMPNDIRELRAELERVQKQNAAMREALELCQRVLLVYNPKPSGLDGAWRGAFAALQSDAGRDYLSKEQVRPLVDALRSHHVNACGGANVFFEQDGKPIDIATDLGEAYQESALCDQTTDALTHAKAIGL